MEPGNFFNLHYYFDIVPKASALSVFVGIYFIGILALRPYLRIVASRHSESKLLRKLQKKHLSKLMTIGILGMATIVARHFMIPFLGMRILAYALIFWSIYEIWAICVVHKKQVYSLAEASKSKSMTDKYIPKPKKKKSKGR